MITVSKEDYLKSILEAESEGEIVISARLAEWHKVSAPAVTMALRRLKKDGLVRIVNSGEVRLTAAGRRIARKLTLRHHLIERMLSEMFGMEWWKVHDEAERLEHAVSPDFESQLLKKLGSAGACPHGNLSEVEGPASRRRRGLVLLADADLGSSYLVSGIYERDRQLLEFLEHRGIRPGRDDLLRRCRVVGKRNCGRWAATASRRDGVIGRLGLVGWWARGRRG